MADVVTRGMSIWSAWTVASATNVGLAYYIEVSDVLPAESPAYDKTQIDQAFYVFPPGNIGAQSRRPMTAGVAFTVPPVVTTIQAKDASLEITFDQPVTVGGSITARESAKDPLISGLVQTSDSHITANWTLSIPTLQSAVSKDDRISLVFDIPSAPGTPTLSRIHPSDPLPTSVSVVSAVAFDILWTLPPSVATLLSATSKDDRISLVFDNPVSIGTPTLSRVNTKDPLPTGMNTVNVDAFDILWTLSVPKLTTATSFDSHVQLDFDLPVSGNFGLVSFPAKQSAKDPTLYAIHINSLTSFDIEWNLIAPTLQSINSLDGGVEHIFDLPVFAGAPAIPPPQSISDPVFSGAGQVTPTAILSEWLLPVVPTVVLITTIIFKVSITWDQPITLTAAGLIPGNWTFTPEFGSAAITCTNVAANIDGETVDLTVTMMTAGTSNYTVHILPAVVVIGGGITNVAADIIFDGADVAFQLVSATAQGSNAVLVTYNDAPKYSTALVPGNYSIDNGLVVHSVEQVLPASVRLHTNEMEPGAIYNLTVSNVTDPAGNPLV